MLSETLSIKKDQLVALEKVLEMEVFDETFDATDQILASFNHRFQDGVRVEINVCAGQHNAWVDALWYDAEGLLISVSEPGFSLEEESVLLDSTNEVTHSLIIEAA